MFCLIHWIDYSVYPKYFIWTFKNPGCSYEFTWKVSCQTTWWFWPFFSGLCKCLNCEPLFSDLVNMTTATIWPAKETNNAESVSWNKPVFFCRSLSTHKPYSSSWDSWRLLWLWWWLLQPCFPSYCWLWAQIPQKCRYMCKTKIKIFIFS